jgi:tetratricopeptide (TPR) repeat protein
MKSSLRLWCLIVAGGLLYCSPACAHDGPEHEIEEITKQIQSTGGTAELLIHRAVEYRIMGQLAEAARDLEQALELDRTSPAAHRELSQAYFALGKTNEALVTVNRALLAPADPANEASLLMTRVGILRARREYAKALQDANRAIATHSGNVEWYLIRSQLHALLKQKRERVHGLEQGIEQTGSGLLHAEWIDALIDNGQTSLALEKIQDALPNARWKSAWWLRRAKALLASGQGDLGRKDLAAAIAELDGRLSVSADALLLAERGAAYDLLNKRAEARRDYQAALDRGLTDERVSLRAHALRDAPPAQE